MNGKEIIKTLYESGVLNADEYETLIKRVNDDPKEKELTWKQVLEDYYMWGSDQYTESTIKGYKVCLYGFIKYVENVDNFDLAINKTFKEYDYRTVNQYLTRLLNDGFNEQTINKIKYAINSLGEYLNSVDISAPDVLSIKIRKTEKSDEIINILREDEIYDIVEQSDLRTKVIISLCYEAALKRIELSKIKIQDFHFDKKQLIIYDESGKDIDRVCILSQKTITLVKDYIEGLYNDIERWNESRVKKGYEVRVDEGYLFQNVKTTVPSYTMLQISLKKTSKRYYAYTYHLYILFRNAKSKGQIFLEEMCVCVCMCMCYVPVVKEKKNNFI